MIDAFVPHPFDAVPTKRPHFTVTSGLVIQARSGGRCDALVSDLKRNVDAYKRGL